MKEYLYRLATGHKNDFKARSARRLLLLLSWLYGISVRMIVACYKARILRAYRLPKPVISVGNITLGGAGKTPLVEGIARLIQERNLKPVVLTRGYGAQESSKAGDEGTPSDEVMMLKESLSGIPILAGPDRVKTARQALKDYPGDVFLMDDGFQHWRLRRDLDIVVIDAENPFGSGHLIPRGILREPLSHLKRAGLFVLTKTDLGQRNLASIYGTLSKINPRCPVVESVHQPVCLVDICRKGAPKDLLFLKGKRIFAFCAIGDPQSFANTLKNLGAKVIVNYTYLDHYDYLEEDMRRFIRFCELNDSTTIVTTHKDAVKLTDYLKLVPEQFSLLYLKIKIDIVKGKDEFLNSISRACQRNK